MKGDGFCEYCRYGLYPGPIDERMATGAISEILKTVEKYIGRPALSLSILDVGSGRGYYALEMAKHFKTVVGVDLYEEAFLASVKLATGRENLRFKNVAIENFETKEKFDVIVALTVFEHMQNQERSFERMFQLLKPGGIIYITAPNKYWLFEQHYGLPFLSWLPLPLANIYLKATKGVDSYEDCSYSMGYFGTIKFFRKFTNNFEFVLPFNMESGYINCGRKSLLFDGIKKIGINLIKLNPLFWMFSKGFIVVAKGRED